MSEYISTGLGYLTLFGVGYAVYHVSTQQAARKRGASAAKAKAAQPEARKEDRKKKQRLDSFAQAVKEKPVITEPETTPAPAPVAAPVDESKANREFAKQLAKAKEGTKFAARSDGKQREKSVKQSKANQIGVAGKPKVEEPVKEAVEVPVEATTTDTQGSENSFVEVERDEIPAEAGRVDDMLEPKQAGPSVLRLTEPTNKQEPKKKTAKAPPKTETKKQRQNRKKAEAAKAARDDAEVERKALEESQRRTARIAEGRAAKDGSQFIAANGTSSSWTQGAPKSEATNGATNSLHEPLDTFEEVKPRSSGNKQQKAAPKPAVEEPQTNTASADDGWSTVTKVKHNKKKENSSVQEPTKAETKAPAPAPAAPTHKKPVAANKSAGAFGLLANDDEEEEVEEEWDV